MLATGGEISPGLTQCQNQVDSWVGQLSTSGQDLVNIESTESSLPGVGPDSSSEISFGQIVDR